MSVDSNQGVIQMLWGWVLQKMVFSFAQGSSRARLRRKLPVTARQQPRQILFIQLQHDRAHHQHAPSSQQPSSYPSACSTNLQFCCCALRWRLETMTEPTSLESLQALHADLLAFSEERLFHVERLEIQLDAHIKDFRGLLDKKPRNEQSRQKLSAGRLWRIS